MLDLVLVSLIQLLKDEGTTNQCPHDSRGLLKHFETIECPRKLPSLPRDLELLSGCLARERMERDRIIVKDELCLSGLFQVWLGKT